MQFQYNKLKGRIKEVCQTNSKFAEEMDISTASISQKLNNKSQWTQPQIFKAVAVLMIEPSDIPAYFFTPLV